MSTLEASRIICIRVFHLHNVLVQTFLSLLSKLEVFVLPEIWKGYMTILLLLSAAKMFLLLSSEWHCCSLVSVTAGCLRASGVCELKQAEDTEGKQRSGHRSCGNSHRHHQQHVLRDSEAWRPSLKAFPEVPPAASATGMRLPLRRHTHTHTFV